MDQVTALRLKVQNRLGCSKADAQRRCAHAARTSYRTWTQWENGLRNMHSSTWELALLNLGAHPEFHLVPWRKTIDTLGRKR